MTENLKFNMAIFDRMVTESVLVNTSFASRIVRGSFARDVDNEGECYIPLDGLGSQERREADAGACVIETVALMSSTRDTKSSCFIASRHME
ncbi:hypothetical protein [Varibaculum vaginae]|uniref:hypothetical protein n=1 Tax=Varibaculum vaginae TaxID=2364797 RepID=UPI000F0793A2|nr:hypothetical protein [Varibaculum vaginae]